MRKARRLSTPCRAYATLSSVSRRPNIVPPAVRYRNIEDPAGVHAEAFPMALINEYRPGSPIGWHRDAPQYGIFAGISLLAKCRMTFRPC